jgi:hypothetical protein
MLFHVKENFLTFSLETLGISLFWGWFYIWSNVLIKSQVCQINISLNLTSYHILNGNDLAEFRKPAGTCWNMIRPPGLEICFSRAGRLSVCKLNETRSRKIWHVLFCHQIQTANWRHIRNACELVATDTDRTLNYFRKYEDELDTTIRFVINIYNILIRYHKLCCLWNKLKTDMLWIRLLDVCTMWMLALLWKS